MNEQSISLATLDYVIIAGFISLIICVGLFFNKRAGKNTDNFFLGGRSLPWYLAGTSMVATTFAADTPLAVTELVRQSGIAGNWLWWNMLAGGMLTTFFFARYWRRANILTDVELVNIRYSGKPAEFLRGFKAVYMGLFLNAAIIAWVNIALMTLLQIFFGLTEVQAMFCALGAMFLVYLYTGFSGLLGVVYTDFIQFIFAMIGVIVLAVIVVGSPEIGGIDGLKAKLPESTFSFFPSFAGGDPASIAGVLSIGVGSFLAMVTLQWWSSWYPGSEPGGGGYIAQRMMSAKDEKNAVYASLFFQIAHFCIRPWPWILVALCAIVLYPDLAQSEARMGYVMAMKDFLPTGMKGMLLAAFFAAYMSTISTQLNWGASYLINDFYKPVIKPKANEKQLIMASRLTVFLMIVVAFGVTSVSGSITGIWNFLITASAGLGLVLILRWYWWRVNAWSEIAATIAPIFGYSFVAFYMAKHVDPSWGENILEDPKGFIATLSFTTVVWVVVTYLTKPTDEKVLKKFYQTVKPAGNWKPFGSGKEDSSLGKLSLAWLFSISMAYSVLFVSGSLIFKNWNDAYLYGSIFIMSLILMRYFSVKAKVFE